MTIQLRLLLARRLVQRLSQRPRRGFTLIELLVVVVIIGILASVALPSFVGAQDRARNASVSSNIGIVRTGLEQYATEHQGAFPLATGLLSKATGEGLCEPKINFMPGDKLPRGPWSTSAQTDILTPSSGLATVTASSIAAGSSIFPTGTLITADVGKVTGVPKAIDDYGFISYDYEPNSQTYLLYGTGKRNKSSVTAGQASNNSN